MNSIAYNRGKRRGMGLKENSQKVNLDTDRDKREVLRDLVVAAEEDGLVVADINVDKPWGAFVRFTGAGADLFVSEFFPGLSPENARLGVGGAELSPKFLIVAPEQRLSWQRHARRAERWAYLTDGAYYKSPNPNLPGEMITARTGEVVQFATGECHRLVGALGKNYTLVAEIWQHTDPNNPSDEDDIERLADDYSR